MFFYQRCREYVYWLIFLVLLFLSVSVLWYSGWNFYVGDIAWHWINAGIGGTMAFSIIYFLFLGFSCCFSSGWKKKGELTGCSVIVPAYNEGKHVAATLESLLKSDFPPDKLQIIAVNDGSGDDTLFWIKSVAEKYPQVVQVIDLPENKGKKAALCAGIKAARFDLVVTVDSDTLVKPDTLEKLLYPLADETIGAVAGTIVKKSGKYNIHTLMCDVTLVFGCGLLRKAQSCCGNVFCTPGALSAYRKRAILPLLDEWLQQTFMGMESRIGEDRAIATLLLRNNWRIVYQPDAVAETSLPESYCGVCRMLLRWTRSDIRENLLMSKYVIKRFFTFKRGGINMFCHWLLLSINMLMPFLLIPSAVLLLFEPADLAYKISLLFVVNVLWSLIPAAVYLNCRKSLRQVIWAFIFGFYAQFAVSWVAIYSFFTLRNSRWLTRELP